MANVYSVQLFDLFGPAGSTPDIELPAGFAYVIRQMDLSFTAGLPETGGGGAEVLVNGFALWHVRWPALLASTIKWEGRTSVPGGAFITLHVSGGTSSFCEVVGSGYQLTLP